MRLICPNCDAQYEVDANAIPASGRDVQCSNCGHGWFQHAETTSAVEEDDAPFGSPEDLSFQTTAAAAETVPDSMAATSDPVVVQNAAPGPVLPTPPDPGEEPEEEEAPPPIPELPRRSIDESLLAVLREEADREATQRKAEEARPIETQPDLGLAEPEPRPRPPVPPAPLVPITVVEPDLEPAKAARSRDLLPDIEEINSTLRASNERRSDSEVMLDEAEAQPGGFSTGFFLMLAVAAGLAAAYVMAPKISEQIPASAGAMQAYVSTVDQGRLWLDGLMQSAIQALQGTQG